MAEAAAVLMDLPTKLPVKNLSRGPGSLLLAIALLLAHAPLIFDNGLFADDWLFFRIRPDYPIQTDVLIHGAGHPFLYAYVTLANLSGHPLGFMIGLALVGIVLGSLSLKSFLVRLGVFSDFDAIVFSFLVWSYAGYETWAVKILATYVFGFALLCAGLNLLSVLSNSARRRIWLRLVGMVAIFCSFSLNSMIAAYGIGLFAIALTGNANVRDGIESLPSRSANLIKRFPDFLVLPIIYWFSTNYFFPKLGPYKDYYLLRLPHADDILAGLSGFWTWGFSGLLPVAYQTAKASFVVATIAIIFGFGFVTLIAWLSGKGQPRPTDGVVATAWPCLAAIGTFIVCASPYLASGIQPAQHFFETRHLILFGIPLGFLLIFSVRLVGLVVSNRVIACGILGMALSANLCALWNGYFFQQARWLKQEAMIDNLRSAYPAPPASVFNLADGFADRPGHTYFGITELTGALHLIWGPYPVFGFSGRSERPTVLRETDHALHTPGSALRNIDIWGPQATIELVPKTPVPTNYALSRNYYLCLLRFCDKQGLIRDLATTDIRVGPIPNLLPRQM